MAAVHIGSTLVNFLHHFMSHEYDTYGGGSLVQNVYLVKYFLQNFLCTIPHSSQRDSKRKEGESGILSMY